MKAKTWIKTALILAVMVIGIVTMVVYTSADQETGGLDIAYCNLSFENDTHLVYAIPSLDADARLLVWNQPQADYRYGTQAVVLEPWTQMNILGTTHTVFKYTGLAAKQMTDDVYVRACVDDGAGNITYGKVHKYSILQYAYNKLGKTGEATTNDKLINMLNQMLAYGASAQEYHGYKTDRLATDEFVQVKLSEGTLGDGFSKGLFRVGETVTVTAPATDASGTAFAYWLNANGGIVSKDAAASLTAGQTAVTYTPVYIKYSEGLEFDSNGDGTCYIIDLGTCTDTALIIPPVSPDGDTVIGIDSSAFSGTEIVSVSIPADVEDIGRRAFNGCTSLTDVYYYGTPTAWADVTIASGNDALTAATMHYVGVAAYKVTFLDWDGTALKEETVYDGNAATAPADPTREGYVFNGWDVAFGQVTSDLTVKAVYRTQEPTLSVQSVTVNKDTSEVSVSVWIYNNPGIMNMVLDVVVDDSVFVFKSATKGSALPSTALTQPGSLQVTSPYRFLLDAMELTEADKTDGDLFTIIFTIKDTAATGTYDITLSYEDGNIVDENLRPITVSVENGKITLD